MYNEVERLLELITTYKSDQDIGVVQMSDYARSFAEASEALVRKIGEKDKTIGRLVTRMLSQ